MKENIRLSFQGIWSHKMRSFLTMLGIIIGIASIITIVSTIRGTNEQIKQNLIGAGNNAVVVQVYQNDYAMEFQWTQIPEGIKPIDEKMRNHLANIEGAADASLFTSRNYLDGVYYKKTAFNGELYGIDSHYLDIYGYELSYGRGFTDADYERMTKCVLLDQRAASTIFSGANPIGEVLEIRGEPFTVIGVVAMNSSFQPTIESMQDYWMYAETTSGKIFMTNAAWPTVYKYDEPYSVAIQAKTTDDMAKVSQKAGELLTANLIPEELRMSSQISYKGRNLMEDAQQLQQITNSTSQQLIWIASISLLVGGIGVMNIMLVSVTERTREIGLKKAIGARRSRILGQFLTEASVLTTIGGLLGVLAGIIMARLISQFMGIPTAVSVPSIILATAFSMVIGLVFGLLPAVKASKLNPIEALRRE
ncbi:MAG: ABC transporter permease [Lachnospiraceae bacterium]|nr:ABC transporter permease [Lachnospiraceae bacterium]